MEKLIKGISYFMAVVGAVTVIWRVAISFQKQSDKTTDLEEKLEKIIERQVKVDTLVVEITKVQRGLNGVRYSLDELIDAQNSLRQSYVLHLQRDKTLKLQDFLEYMDGVEFELKRKTGADSSKYVINGSDVNAKYNSKIKVTKIKK